MDNSEGLRDEVATETWLTKQRRRYDGAMQAIRAGFDAQVRDGSAGAKAIAARSSAVDATVQAAWLEASGPASGAEEGVALVAVGGYGRCELLPYSDVDLMILVDARLPEAVVKDPIRQVNQMLWDIGLRVSPMTRTLADCERFDAENVEFTLSLLDARLVSGSKELFEKLTEKVVPKLLGRERARIRMRLLDVTRARHAKYGETLFHLEPNVKDCRGGLRDAHVCAWLERLDAGVEDEPASVVAASSEFMEARQFMLLVRTFLHLRHGRDDNTLDWQAQDAAAEVSLGAGAQARGSGMDAAYWMRQYFRRARSIERRIAPVLGRAVGEKTTGKLRASSATGRKASVPAQHGFEVKQGRISIGFSSQDPAHDPEVVLAICATIARSGARLSAETEARLEQALPLLSANLEDGPDLWRHLQDILLGGFAGQALRTMHALGLLELLIPEFHGIDALVIRDAYHRYTVDEHTFVLIDTLHGLGNAAGASGGLDAWRARFAGLFRDLPHPELLLLASLLHDTGKGHATDEHSAESARMAANVLERLELDSYEAGLVLELIRNHLEMSAALRRDVFDQETIRSFAARVPNPEALRMLTLFTYADIAAVHPDALTPWKAENLWRLFQATGHFLDRSVDEQRVASEADSALGEVVLRIHALLPEMHEHVTCFLDGFPRRYLQTRTPETVAAHAEMAARLDGQGVELSFRWMPDVSELTLVTTDRPRLFASVAGALAGWGMNIVTADAFSNEHGVVVDSFRFTDTFRTLELNESERERFVQSVRGVIIGTTDLELLLASRRRGRRRVPKVSIETRVEFDESASTHSTLLEVIAQDTPGLLRALSLTLAEHACNIEVALVDTEGEMAIDVFYVTRGGAKLDAEQREALKVALLEAVEQNAR